MKTFALLVTLVLAGGAAQAADKYYLAASESATGVYGAFLDPTRWTPSAETFDSTADYVVRNKALRLVVDGASSKTFAGGRLILGEDKNHGALLIYTSSPDVTTFDNDGLSLVHGCIQCTVTAGKTNLTAGAIAVNTGDDSYTHISFNADNQTFSHAGSLSVASEKRLVVGGLNGFQGAVQQGGTAEFKGDCSGVLGTVEASSPARSKDGTLTTSPDTTVAFGTTTIPGTIVVGTNCQIRTVAAADTTTIATLKFAANTFLDVPVDGTAVGKVVVTGSFVHDGVIKVSAPALNTVAGAFPIVVAPAASGLTDADFELLEGASDPYRSLTVETADGTTTVSLVYAAVPVYQTVSSVTMGTSESWSDGTDANKAGKHYMVDVRHLASSASSATFYLPTNNLACAFLGESLTFDYACNLRWSRDPSTEFTCRHLRLLNGSALNGDDKAGLTITGGKVTVLSGTVAAGVYNNRMMTIKSELDGSATLRLVGKVAGTSSAPYGQYELTGTNTDFFGRIELDQRYTVKADGSALYNDYANKYQTLYVGDARNLGGRLPTLEPKALVLAKYGKLSLRADVTIAADSNRGVFIDGTGRVDTVGHTLRLETPLGVNGTFYKEGAGRIDLAGAAAFGEDGASATPTDGLNAFVVTGGTVRVCAAGAVDGFKMDFAPGAALELAVDLDNAALTASGIRNVKAGATPFVLPEGVDELPLRLVNVGSAPADGRSVTVGVVTVSSEAAESVQAMLPAVPPKVFRGYSSAWAEPVSDAETGAVTFAVVCERIGVTLIIR